MSSVDSSPEKHKRWTISQRLKKAIRVVKTLESDELEDLRRDLETCRDLFEERNEVVHGRIYAGYGRGDNAQLRSSRDGVPDRDVTSEELYDLANTIFNFQSSIRRQRLFAVPRILSER